MTLMTGARITGISSRARLLLAALALALASGCATNGADPRDPIERFNRTMYGFNESFDQAIGKPVATAYRDVLPGFVRTGVRNFFANIDDLFIGVNNLLQGKLVNATGDFARLMINTTIGLFGVLDWASDAGLEKHNEDFGQTFGRWGVADGPYIVWPIVGSSTLRDSVGGWIDIHFDPVRNHRPVATRDVLLATRYTGRRADLLDASRVLEEAALDKYVFQRDAHLQRRRSLIYDGNPPREERSMRELREPRAEQVPAGRGGPISDHASPRVAGDDDAVLAASGKSDADHAERQPRVR